MPVEASEILANSLYTALVAGAEISIPVVDLTTDEYVPPAVPTGPLYATIDPLLEVDITDRTVAGTGLFDGLMVSLNLHLKQEYDKGRITGKEYSDTYIALTQSALASSISFLQSNKQAYWQSILTQQQAQAAALAVYTGRVQLEIAKVQLMTSRSEANMMSANYTLSKLKLAEVDTAYETAMVQKDKMLYELASLMPAELAKINKEVDVATSQIAKITADTSKVTADEANVTYQTVSLLPGQLGQVTAQTAQVAYQTANILPGEVAKLTAETSQATAQTSKITADEAAITYSTVNLLPAQLGQLTAQTAQVTYQTANILPEELAKLEAQTAQVTYQTANTLPGEVAKLTAETSQVTYQTTNILPEELAKIEAQTSQVTYQTANILPKEVLKLTAETSQTTAQTSKIAADTAAVTYSNTNLLPAQLGQLTAQTNQVTYQTTNILPEELAKITKDIEIGTAQITDITAKTGKTTADTAQTAYQTTYLLPSQLAQLTKQNAQLDYHLVNHSPKEVLKIQSEIDVASGQISHLSAQTTQATYQTVSLLPAQKLGVDADTAVKSYTLVSMLPAQLAGITADTVGKTYNNVSILPEQLANLQEQTESNRAKTLDTRTDGVTAISGAIGKQKALQQQQIDSYKRDAETKVVKMLLDTWITQKSLDEGLTPPITLSDANINNVLEDIQTNLNIWTALVP